MKVFLSASGQSAVVRTGAAAIHGQCLRFARASAQPGIAFCPVKVSLSLCAHMTTHCPRSLLPAPREREVGRDAPAQRRPGGSPAGVRSLQRRRAAAAACPACEGWHLGPPATRCRAVRRSDSADGRDGRGGAPVRESPRLPNARSRRSHRPPNLRFGLPTSTRTPANATIPDTHPSPGA